MTNGYVRRFHLRDKKQHTEKSVGSNIWDTNNLAMEKKQDGTYADNHSEKGRGTTHFLIMDLNTTTLTI